MHPAVTVRLLQDGKPYVLSDGSADGDSGGGMDGGTGGNTDGDSGGSGMKLVLSEENGWTGTFAHVPRERWSYTSYEASERTESLVRLSDHSYTVEEDVPEGCETRIIPASLWAQFPCTIRTLQDTNTKIWSEWLPALQGYTLAGEYDIEVYLPPEEGSDDMKVYIWVPLKQA